MTEVVPKSFVTTPPNCILVLGTNSLVGMFRVLERGVPEWR